MLVEPKKPETTPDERLGTYLVTLDSSRNITYTGVYPDVICDRHGSVLKICKSGKETEWDGRAEIVIALFQHWDRVERIEE